MVGRRFDTDTLAAVVGRRGRTCSSIWSSPRRPPGSSWRRASTGTCSPTRWCATRCSPTPRPRAGPAPTPGSPRCSSPPPGRESEVARHWLAAGPAYAARAWRAAARAAEQARGLHAHEEAAELLGRGAGGRCRGSRQHPGGPLRPPASADRGLPLVREASRAGRCRAGSHRRRAGRWATQELAVRAALSATQGGLWQSAPDGQVNERVVGTLRAALEWLPPDDGDLRCRVLLALANEESTVVPMPRVGSSSTRPWRWRPGSPTHAWSCTPGRSRAR